jgi:NAD(P)-dependent dehydrogenase (short-subunit alcohol dehydrogenase family)
MPDATNGLFDLHGRVAVVTGGNRGIGLGIARGLARAGASVSIWSRDEGRNAEAAAELEALGAPVHAARCDVSEESDVARALASTLERFGRVDAGFANAGFGKNANALELDLEEWHRILRTNLDGVFLTFRELGRHMSEREGGGKLVAISSISAIFSTPAQPHYAASKGGLEALVRSFAGRLARYDVQVNALQPGWIESEATQRAVDDEDFTQIVMRRTPARRWGRPEDFEGIAVYLASDASRYHTGDTIRVDGGYTIF